MFAASIQGEGVFTKKQFPKQPRYNAGLIPHRRIKRWAWVLCVRPRSPLAFLELGPKRSHIEQSPIFYY